MKKTIRMLFQFDEEILMFVLPIVQTQAIQLTPNIRSQEEDILILSG
jgi:hypothetical protein